MAHEFSWASYWQWQSRSWITHDIVALFCKIMLLTGNVVTKAYTKEDKQRILVVQVLAMICALGQLPTLWLIWSKQDTYLRYRRVILQLHWVSIVSMVDVSLPLLVATKLSHGGGIQHLLSFVFRLSGFINITLSAMHRLPWQPVALFSGVYGAWIVVMWTQPYCSVLLNDPVAGLDNCQLLTSVAAVFDFVTGHGEYVQAGSHIVWQPYAHVISAACTGGNSSSMVKAGQSLLQGDHTAVHCAYRSSASGGNISFPASNVVKSAVGTALFNSHELCFMSDAGACEVLLQGQCVAVTRTLTVWLTVLVLVAAIIFFERYNKWTYVHVHAPWALNKPGLPAMYAETDKRVFVTKQLLQLHVLLDVPLFVLWMGFCSWSRPAGAVRKLLASKSR